MVHFTVFSANSGYVLDRGLTALKAMAEILNYDGYDWKFSRRKGDGCLSLWHSDGSANSTRGARHFVKTTCFSFKPGLEGQREIALQVISATWRGRPEAMTDADYDAMVSESEQAEA